MMVMKFASPIHRGTTCMCRWSASDPPDTLPRFRPTLKPIGLDTLLMTRIAFWVNDINSALSASVRSSSSDTTRWDHHEMSRVVRVQVQHDVYLFAASHHQPVLVG